jgi:hypothetical protein
MSVIGETSVALIVSMPKIKIEIKKKIGFGK